MSTGEDSQSGARRRFSEGVIIALITAGGTVIASIVTGGFGLAGNSDKGGASPGGPVATVTVTGQPQAGSPAGPATGGVPSSTSSRPQPTAATFLTNLEPVREDENGFGLKEWKDGPMRIDGRDYGHGIAAFGDICTAAREYSISRRYQRFRATAGFADDSEATEPMVIKITVDGQTKYSEPIRLAHPAKIDLDISNGVRLGVIVQSTDYCSTDSVTVALGDPRLDG